MRTTRVPVACFLFLTALLPVVTVHGQTGKNEWTKPTSGYWEESFWSLGQLPSHAQVGIVLNNPGFKALAIGANTTANFPASLSIQNLLVAAPVGSANQLLLNYAGLTVPLRIDMNLRIGTNSSLLSYSSAVRAANFYVGGVATFDALSEATFTSQVAVGVDGSPAELNVLSGTFYAGNVAVSNRSTLNLSNGVFRTGGLALNFPASGPAAAVVNIAGGSMIVSNTINIRGGNIAISGGGLRSTGITVFGGELRQSGGTNKTGVIRLPDLLGFPPFGEGRYYLSGGTLISSSLSLGDALPGGFWSSNGLFEQTGGYHTNSAGISTWGVVRQARHTFAGTYRLMDGLLVTPSIRGGGAFEQLGGTNRAGTISVDASGWFVFSGGSLYSSNTVVGPGGGSYDYWRDLRSVYTQGGGTHVASVQFSSIEGGYAGLGGGSLTTPSINVGPEGELSLGSAVVVTNSGTFTMFTSGRLYAGGNHPQLGKLIVKVGGIGLVRPAPLIRFNSATLRFQDSRDAPWDSPLTITNWNGSPNGNGTDRLYVGNSSQGLTRDQLARITFVKPAGLPPGNYPATILPTGEVVPGPRPTISSTRSSNRMVISWSSDYQLFTSTNVTGPYTAMTNATSPYTVTFSGPQRFFLLRSP